MRHAASLSAALALAFSLAGCSKPPPAPPPPVEEPAPPPPPKPADPLRAAGYAGFTVRIDGPLETALRGAVPSNLAAPLAQISARHLVWWVDVTRGLRSGDQLTVVYEEVAGSEPRVHALKYFSNKLGREQRSYFFKSPELPFPRYYDEKGDEVEERLEHSPVDQYEQITSLLRDGRRHKGVDFKTPSGTPVKAPFDATLTRKNWNFRANGNSLELKDGKGHRILFLHLSELPRSLQVGQRFRRGQVIAESGNSGRSTAPHLHYQLENASGKVLDPFVVHKTWRASLDPSHRAAFDAHRALLDEQLDFLERGAGATPAAFTAEVPQPAEVPSRGTPGVNHMEDMPLPPLDLGPAPTAAEAAGP